MSAKLQHLKRRQYKKVINRFAESEIGRTINKKMKLNKHIIIGQWITIAALVAALIGVITL